MKINDKFLLWQSYIYLYYILLYNILYYILHLSILYKYWHSVNLFCSRTYTRATFRTQSNIYNKAFLWLLQRYPITDVPLGSKYASAYIYTQVGPIEIILRIILIILNICNVKYIFLTKDEWKTVAVSEFKLLSLHFISAYSF